MSPSGGPIAPRRLIPILLLAALAGLGGLAYFGGVSERPLTILLISLDTVRPDHLTAYGYDRPTTPTLARMAREGAVFTAARSTSSWTLPAHMSLFTGLPPGLHGVVIDLQVLDDGHRTLGEVFRDAGFQTAGVFAAPYVHGDYGFRRGMEYYERGTLEPMVFDLPPALRKAQLTSRERQGHREVTSELVTDRALDLLKRMRGPRRLCFLHYFDAHYDYMAPSRITSRFVDGSYRGPITGENAWSAAPSLGDDPPAADRAQIQAYYDAELAFIDENLDRLLDRLEQRGELDDTLVVIVSDHGEEFWEHGRFGHRFGLHDETLRIPLLVWGPGRVPEGRVITNDVSIIDVLPTLMDYAGLPASPAMDGRSLRPLIDGRPFPPQPVTAALSFFPPTNVGRYTLHEAFVADGLKLIRRVDVPWSPDNPRGIGGPPLEDTEVLEAYDLVADRGERHNLVGGDDPRVGPLVDAFNAERNRQRERHAAFRPAGSAAPPMEGDIYDSMKAMGYLQGHDQ